MRYRVAPKCSVKSPETGKALIEGTVIGEGFSEADIASLLDGGFLEEAVETDVLGGPPPAPVQEAVHTSLWDEDPAGLMDKTLEQLNIKILEKDSEIAPFETIEEARAWLSQDFGK